MHTKTCRTCGKYLAKSNPRQGWQCKDCWRAYKRKWRRERIEKGFNVNPPYNKEWQKAYRQRPYVKKYMLELSKKYKENPAVKLKFMARWISHKAIKSGKLVKGVCTVCGLKTVEGHHLDYYAPLKVVWLCQKHHRKVHQKQ